MESLLDLLATQREEVARCFEGALRARLPTAERSALRGSLPRLLDGLQAALEAGPQGLAPTVARVRVPGLPRSGAGPGFSVEQLVQEHGLLRDCLLRLLEERGGSLRLSELRVLHRCMDQSLESALADQERQDAVARNAALLEAILQSIPDAVYVGDITGITHANAPARAMIGERFEHLTPLSLGELLHCRCLETGARLAPEEEPFARALRGEAVTREVMIRHPGSGKDLVVRCAAAPVRMSEHIVGAVAVSTDLTEHQLREEELRRTAEFRERFLGIVSHDLRNPLNSISLSANMLLREEELPARSRKTAGRITQSAERMGRMISDLLDFTRGRLGGGIPLTRRPGDLRQICRPVLEELGMGGPGSPLRLSTEGDFQGEWDADRLAQLVGNLVKNALDYSPQGSPVTVSLSDEGTWIRLEVHNHGESIPPEVLPRLFEPFRRGMREGEESQHSGLGLGLFIARQITQAHGGTLEAHSTQEDGTTFRVRLPRAMPDA
ncbi:MAG TPA: ATP-binding protein [Myxococcaceae bacterium]|jgi:signal transduction histidine kinase